MDDLSLLLQMIQVKKRQDRKRGKSKLMIDEWNKFMNQHKDFSTKTDVRNHFLEIAAMAFTMAQKFEGK